jgi:hypothetical protein
MLRCAYKLPFTCKCPTRDLRWRNFPEAWLHLTSLRSLPALRNQVPSKQYLADRYRSVQQVFLSYSKFQKCCNTDGRYHHPPSEGSAASLADVMDFAGTDKAESLTAMVRFCSDLHPFTQHQHPSSHRVSHLQP